MNIERAAVIASEHEILRGVVGSTCHGTAVDGQDDRDEMAVFIEPAVNVCGLEPCDHYVFRTAAEGQRSGPGDLDLVAYSLRKFCRLAIQGNPTVILLLWLPSYITQTLLGAQLVARRDYFISQESGARFLGYLDAQRQKLLGERSPKVSRPEFVEKFGYDTKFAMHALRLAFEGIELMETGHLTLPVSEPNLSMLRDVRTGQVPFDTFMAILDGARSVLAKSVFECQWSAQRSHVNSFMSLAHQEYWARTR